MLWLTVLAAALAGDLQVVKKTGNPAFLWIDGQPSGQLTKRSHRAVALDDRLHEVWVARDAGGTWTICHGTLDVTGGARLTVRGLECEGFTGGTPPATFHRGGEVRVQWAGMSGTISLDGGPMLPLWYRTLVGNVSPGQHHVQLWVDGVPRCDGKVDVPEGGVVHVLAQPFGCEGLR